MTVVNIRISTIEEVKKFVNTVSLYDYDVDLKSGRYVVDAKSIMGIFSLDLLNPIEMTVHADSCDDLLEAIAPMIIK